MEEINLNDQIDLSSKFNTLLDLSNDIDRNRQDHEFAKSNGEIIYVFDSLLFRIFCEPDRLAYAFSSFHSPLWRNIGAPSDANIDSIPLEAQTALIASEYLFSEDLPGAKNSEIFISPWHGSELNVFVKSTYKSFIRELTGPKSKTNLRRAAEEIEDKIKLVEDFNNQRNDDYLSMLENESLKQDIALLDGIVVGDDLTHFQLARQAATTLVDCKLTEPLDQMYRILTDPIASRIKSLENRFEINLEQRQEIGIDARKWFSKFSVVLEKDNQLNESTKLQAWNDARTIALVRWIANFALREDQRIVYVTPSTHVFDAYRDWYVQRSPDTQEFYEDFLLRRTAQYTPIFSLDYAGKSFSNSSAIANSATNLFNEVNEAVELQLLPFKLAKSQWPAGDEKASIFRKRGREYLPLKFNLTGDTNPRDSTRDFFLRKQEPKWFETQGKSIAKIVSKWQTLERLCIGYFLGYVVNRVEDDRKLFGADFELNLKSDYGLSVENYLAKVVDQIIAESYESSVASAQEFLSSSHIGPFYQRRAPRTIWNRLPSKQYIFEVIEKLPSEGMESLGDLDKILGHSTSSLFSIAATLAISNEDWQAADHFANSAMNSLDQDLNDDPYEFEELRFLKALTLRFTMGAVSTHLEERTILQNASAARSSFNEARANYRSAQKILISQIKRYTRSSANNNRALLSLVRAQSELASLKLFYAYTLLATDLDLDEKREIPSILKHVRRLHNLCLKKDRDLAEMTGIHKALHMRLRTQYFQNIAACDALLFLNSGEIFPNPNKIVLKHFSSLSITDLLDLSPMSQIEACIFLTIHNKHKTSHIAVLNTALDAKDLKLPLDTAIGKIVNERLIWR